MLSSTLKIALRLSLVVIYVLLLWTIVFCLHYAFLYYKSFVFLRWAKRQSLVLVAGGPSSGKKLLLSFLGHNLRKKTNSGEVYNLLTLYTRNQLFDIKDQNGFTSYSGYFGHSKEASTFLINEIADKPVIKRYLSSSSTSDNSEIVSELQKAHYHKKKIWIAFSEKDGYLWQRLSVRTNAILICERVGSFRFLFKKFYFLKMYSNFNGSNTTRFVLLNEKVRTRYEKHWQKSFQTVNPLLNNL